MAITYKKAGVDIDKANEFIKLIAPMVKKTFNKKTTKGIGGFGGFFEFDNKKFKNPVLVSSTDGVGTKLKLAFLLNKNDTVGIDLVAMNVNDILCTGAKPLFFLDYLACNKMEPQKMAKVLKGVVEGCRQAGCALVGGENAEMPGIYQKGEYDLAGFCVGVVEKNKILGTRNVKPGDVAIGIASSGLHSNGYSLARKALGKDLKKYAKVLLVPTRIYVKPVLSLLNKFPIKSMAHVTGGAFYEKVPRALPKNCSLIIEKDSWHVPEIFKIIQKKGKISDKEMYRTFNMGIGMILIVAPKDARKVIAQLADARLKSWVIGKVIKGNKRVEIA